MSLIDFLSAYGYLVVVGFQAIVLGISGLYRFIRYKMSPDTKKEEHAKKIIKISKKIEELNKEVNAYVERFGSEGK